MIRIVRNKNYIKGFLFCAFLLLSSTVSFGQLSSKDTATVQFINSRKFYIYKVEKGETLFSISQKFKIPQEEILELNSEIEKSGLKNKMKIWIPAYSWLKKDSVTAVEVKSQFLESYKIAIVTSLQLSKIYTGVDTSGIPEPFSKEVEENLEFIEGVFSSADLHKNKFRVQLIVIDAEGDSLKMLLKLRKHRDVNLIITNESGSLLKTLSSFSESYNVKLFACGANTFEAIRKNENAFSILPSSAAQCEQAGIFAARYFNQSNPIAMRTATWKENERSESFAHGWKKITDKHIRQPDYSKGGAEAISDSLIKSGKNLLFIPTSNEEIVSSVLNAVKDKTTEYNLNVIGLPTWQFFETVDQKLLDLCNVHLFSSGLIDYNNDTVTSFRKHFREKYNTEPSDISFQGYDAFTIADALFQSTGTNLVPDEKLTVKGIYSDYHFARTDTNACFENRIIHVFQPSKEGYTDLARNVKFN